MFSTFFLLITRKTMVYINSKIQKITGAIAM